MTDEDVRRTMHFILEQQAQLTATVGRLSEKVDRTADGINALLAVAEIHEREIEANKVDIAALKEIVAANAEAIAADREASRAMDERVNALVLAVEQLISERRNGGR